MAWSVENNTQGLAPQPSSCGPRTFHRLALGELFYRVADHPFASACGRRETDEEEEEPRHPSAFSRRSMPDVILAKAS